MSVLPKRANFIERELDGKDVTATNVTRHSFIVDVVCKVFGHDRSGYLNCTAAKIVPHARKDAAPAITASAQGRIVPHTSYLLAAT